tara:strand:+ start:1517 stop:1642 length:126 start_codon:yes stop_codon:yes gene_type:complete
MLNAIKLVSICILAALITIAAIGSIVAAMVFGTIALGCGPF